MGRNPKNEKGEWFARSYMTWFMMWDFIKTAAPELASQIKDPTYTQEPLSEEFALALAEVLKKEIVEERIYKYIEEKRKKAENPDYIACEFCGGTGRRKKPPEKGPGDVFCNFCNGTGKVVKDDDTPEIVKKIKNLFGMVNAEFVLIGGDIDSFIDNLLDFIEFLENCGGFKIA